MDETSIDFAGLIREGDLVVCGQATAEPRTLTEALVAQAEDLPPFRLMVGPVFSDTFAPDRAKNISYLSYGVIGNARRLARAGRLDVIASNYSAFCADFADGRAPRRCRAGAAGARRRWTAQCQPLQRLCHRGGAPRALVIAEVNPSAPWTFGAEWPDDVPIHISVAARIRRSSCHHRRSTTSHAASPRMRQA